MVARQENSLKAILAQEARLSIKINHVGERSYSKYTVDEFNDLSIGGPEKSSGSTIDISLAAESSNAVKIVAEITTNHLGDMKKLFNMISLAF